MRMMVAYDGSKAAEAALQLVKERAKQTATHVLIATSSMATEGTRHLYAAELEEIHRRLMTAKKIFDNEQIPCDIYLSDRGNEPGEDIVRLAKEHDVDQLVVGVRKRSKVGKLLIGSVAQYIILHAVCPVLAVKAKGE